MFIELCCRQYSHSRAFSSVNTSFATHLVLFSCAAARLREYKISEILIVYLVVH